ncbi:MAG: serine hydrolase domain-containing protein [Gemmatimonadota bacterium]
MVTSRHDHRRAKLFPVALVLVGLATVVLVLLVLRLSREEPLLVSWPVATPEREGLDLSALEDLAEGLANRGTRALLVARHGRIVLEWYAPEFDADRTHYAASMVKGTAAAPALAVAARRGLLSLDDPAAKWIPEWATDSERADILLRHLAFHSSGLDDIDFDAGTEGELPGWKQRYYDYPNERFRLAIDSTDVRFAAGTGYGYSGVGYYILSYIVTRALAQGADSVRDISTLLDEAVYRPVGIPPDVWSIGYGRVDHVDGLPLTHFGSGGRITARAAARIGQLFLQEGCWQGEQILDPDLVRTLLGRGPIDPVPPGDATGVPTSAGGWWPTAASGGGWWLDGGSDWPAAARGSAAAIGYGHQIVWIDPKIDLVVARLGDDLTSRREPFDVALTRYFVEPLYDAVGRTIPLRESLSSVASSQRTGADAGESCGT